MRTLAIVYGALVLGIVVAADVGVLGPLVRGLHAVPLGDKVCHLVLASGLGFVAASLPNAPRLTPWLPVATLVVVVVAILEEISQRFIAGRTFDLLDLAADGVGIAVGTALALRRLPAVAPSH